MCSSKKCVLLWRDLDLYPEDLLQNGEGVVWPLNAVPNSSWVLEDFVIVAAFFHFVSEKMNLGKVAGLDVLLKQKKFKKKILKGVLLSLI